jgi:uncharacterized protein
MQNNLGNETSPYLLQHAHNPVHWQPWGKAALSLAKTLDKPILVSIGYAACHWCHVMEKESFEDETVAAIMNQNFINIKIDREERPDVDHLYMDALQAMTGSGGWPLNVFLTPDAKPFYGGTYFPPVKVQGRASWKDVLESIHNNWVNKREVLEEQADNLVAHLKKSNNFIKQPNNITPEVGEKYFTKADCEAMLTQVMSRADNVKGGFGGSPKFPQTFAINFLLHASQSMDSTEALQHAELCLQQMYFGGIYDQLGGGLSRYSTDVNWLAPHFEKMLYDNALFVASLSDAYLITQKQVYKEAILQTIQFLQQDLKCPTGGYYAAIDADSEGEEGKFYVWDKLEIDKILGEDAALFNAYFNVTENGNWEHKNILHIKTDFAFIAHTFGLNESEAIDKINAAKATLLSIRNKRIKPQTDDKILLNWNALLVTGFCKAYTVLQDDAIKQEAVSLFGFLQQNFKDRETQNYLHSYKNGQAKHRAFLDDYAYLIDAAIHLQEITADENYLFFAKELVEFTFENFYEPDKNYFYYTHKNQTDIIVKKVELYDGATASANAIMCKNLQYLGLVFCNQYWVNISTQMLVSLKKVIIEHTSSFAVWASAALNSNIGYNELLILGENAPIFNAEICKKYIPNKVLICSKEESKIPLTSKKYVFQKTFLYLCLNSVCNMPYENTQDLLRVVQRKVN